jgi:hypothetical protein
MAILIVPQYILAQPDTASDIEISKKAHLGAKQKPTGKNNKKLSTAAQIQAQRQATIKHLGVVLNALGKMTKPNKTKAKISFEVLNHKDVTSLADSLCETLKYHPEKSRILNNKPILQRLHSLPSKRDRADHIEQLNNSRGILSILAHEIFLAIGECMDFCTTIIAETVHFVLAPFAPKPVAPTPLPQPIPTPDPAPANDDEWDDSDTWDEEDYSNTNSENWSE